MSDYDLGKKLIKDVKTTAKMAAKELGVDVPLEPSDTEIIAISAGLSPIADGQAWRAGLNLAEGTIITHGGKNYQVIQGHISQADWQPDKLPALFKTIAEDFADWVQPHGAHDAYQKGDKVTYSSKLWISDVDSNVWQPGVHGWSAVSA